MSANDVDLPFEPGDYGHLQDEHFHTAGGLVVLAAAVDVPESGKMPGLVFRFIKPDGSGMYPPVVLVMTDDHMAKLRPLIFQAIHHARAKAKES